MTGIQAHAVHLYPRWVLSKGNGTLICISRQTLALFAPLFLQLSYLLQGLQNTKNNSVWCAGWSDTAHPFSKSRVHAAAAEAGGPNLHVSSSAALKST